MSIGWHRRNWGMWRARSVLAAVVIVLAPFAHAQQTTIEGPNPAFQTLYTTALAQLAANRPIAAQLSLRRAFRHATSADQQALLQAAYAHAAEANPWTLNFGVNLAPTSNFNGGAAAEFFALGDILLAFPAAALALSGTEVSAHAEVSYRLSKGPLGVTVLGLSIYGRSYVPSPAARAAVPNVTGSDYALLTGDLALRRQWIMQEGLGPTTLSLHLGRSDYGRAPLYRSVKLAMTQDYLLPKGLFSLGVSYEDQDSQSTARADAQIYDGKLAYASRAANGTLWKWTLGARKTFSPLRSDIFHDLQASLQISPAWRILGAAPTLSLGLGHKHYDNFILSFDGRRDQMASLGLGLTFENIAVMGFSPVLTLTSTRTQSNIARYETTETRATFGLQSRF